MSIGPSLIERNEQGKVVRVSFFMNEQIFDAGLVNLQELTELKWLYLNEPQVTDEKDQPLGYFRTPLRRASL